MLLTCQCCGRRCIEYSGKGRPPKYCKRCKPWVNEEAHKQYNKNRKINKKQKREINRRYYLKHKRQLPNNSDTKKKPVEYYKNWQLTHWREMNINGLVIFVRCDAYSVWWRWKQRQSKEYQKDYQDNYRQKPKVKDKQKDYHKNHREKYHRGSDMGLKPRRYASGDINLKNERSVIDAEFKRLGLRKGGEPSKNV